MASTTVDAMPTAERTIAIGRNCGAHRFCLVQTHDQHDFAKVNRRV
jgi:hypothetical protein